MVCSSLYYWTYPFLLSKSFQNYNNQADCILKLQLIKAISVKGTKKIFYLSDFLEQIKLSNKKIVKVKQDLIFLIQEVVQEEIIQSKIRFVDKNNHIQDLDQDKLNPKHREIKKLRACFETCYE